MRDTIPPVNNKQSSFFLRIKSLILRRSKNHPSPPDDAQPKSRGYRIALNTAWLFLSQIVANIAALFVIGFVAHHLGTEGYGELEGALAFAAIFSPIVFAGIQIILIREVVGVPLMGPRAVGDAIILRLAMTPIFAGLVFLAAPFFIPEVRLHMVFLAIVNFFFVNFLQSWTIPCEASERMHFMAIGSFLTAIVGMGLSIMAILLHFGPTGVMSARVLGQIAQAIFMFIVLVVVFYWPKFEFDFDRYQKILRQGFPLALSFLLGLMLLRIDQAMLMAMRGKAEVGLYSSATELAYKFEMIVISFQTALVPGLVATWKEGSEAYSDLLGKAMRFMLILSLPVAAGTGFIAPDIIKFIFKEQYLPAAYVLTVLMWFVPFQFLNRILGVSLAARGMEKWVSVGVAIAVLANVGLNLLLIPRYGFEGAGYATVVTELLLMLIYIFLQREHFVEIVKNLKLGRVAVALGVMVLGCYLLRNQHALIIIASGVVTYGISVFAFDCIDRKELRAITGK